LQNRGDSRLVTMNNFLTRIKGSQYMQSHREMCNAEMQKLKAYMPDGTGVVNRSITSVRGLEAFLTLEETTRSNIEQHAQATESVKHPVGHERAGQPVTRAVPPVALDLERISMLEDSLIECFALMEAKKMVQNASRDGGTTYPALVGQLRHWCTLNRPALGLVSSSAAAAVVNNPASVVLSASSQSQGQTWQNDQNYHHHQLFAAAAQAVQEGMHSGFQAYMHSSQQQQQYGGREDYTASQLAARRATMPCNHFDGRVGSCTRTSCPYKHTIGVDQREHNSSSSGGSGGGGRPRSPSPYRHDDSNKSAKTSSGGTPVQKGGNKYGPGGN